MARDESLGKGQTPVVQTPIAVSAELPAEEHESPDLHDDHVPHRLGSFSTDSVHSAEHETSDEEAQDFPTITRTTSKAISVKIVPRNQRAGLLGRFSILYEAEEPKNYPRRLKWVVTFVIALAAVTAPMGSSIILPALPEIEQAFDTTAFVANLSVAFYMLSMSIFPLWWSAFSEAAGRRTVYLTSFTLYTIFNIIAARSTSIGMFIALRILSGGTSAAVQAVGAGTVADIWEPKERGRGMGIFYLGPLCGPLFAPIIGGLLTEGLGWRSTQWFQVIYGGFMVFAVLLFLPETHKTSQIIAEAEQAAGEIVEDPEKNSQRPPLTRVSTTRSVAVSVKKESIKWAHILYRLFIEPLTIIRYLRFPPVALTIYYASIAFCALYFLNISVEYTFSTPPYNFGTIQVGLLYLPNSLGYLLTSLLGGKWVDNIMAREARKAGRIDPQTGKLIYLPEDRLKENAWVGAMLMPTALLWYGWCTNFHVFWFAPILANFFYGCGSMLIFAAATTMLTEFMPKKASNGVALNNFVRNIGAFLGTLLAEPAIKGIGNGWLFTILGGVAFVSCGVIFAMKRWGERWRVQMDREMD